MNSSGIKRGLAGSAIAALAVTGLPFLATSASATPLSSQAAALTLVSPSANGTPLSAKNDGSNTTVRLEAIAPATVTAVTFQYKIGAGSFTDIGTATGDNGAFSLEWNPSAIAGATNVTIRATATVSGAPVTSDITGVAVNNTLDTVNVTDGDAVGVFQSPYGGGENWVALSGTDSAPHATPSVSWWKQGTGFTGATTASDTTGSGATTGSWVSMLDIQGYPYGGASDQLLVNATEPTGLTEDAEAFTLYKQTITKVTATPKATNVPAGSPATPVAVTVTDQNGKPIAGARVKNSDGTQTHTTDVNGKATFTQNPGSDYYYADATNTAGYNPELGDQKSDTVTINQYNAAPTTLKGSSHDGAAFDLDEYANGDITVQITDQNGNPIKEAGRTVQYYWVETPFDGAPASQRFPATLTTPAVTDANGVATISFPTGQTDPSGSYKLFASLDANALGNGAIPEGNVLTVKAGQGDIKYDAGANTGALAGTSVDVKGKFVLEDGTALPNRAIQFSYATADAHPAGIVQSDGTVGSTRTIKTGADGTFTVTVKDQVVTPNQDTERGLLTGTTQDSDFVGDGGNDGNANDSSSIGIVFAQGAPPAGSTIEVSDMTPGNNGKPGVAVGGSVTVLDASHNPVVNQVVTLTVDGNSFFTDGNDKSTANGAKVGDLTNSGQSMTTVTNASGVATFAVGIGRSAEFDDDGKAEDIVKAAAGSISDTEDVDYNSVNPLNPGEVTLELADASEQESGVLPKAPVSDEVALQAVTTDQFGNRVGGEGVEVTGGSNDVWVTTGFGLHSGIADVNESHAGDVDYTGTWEASTDTYQGGVPTGGTKTLTDSTTVNWYEVDFANSTFTLSHSGADTQDVGATVVETFTGVDQFGEPIADLGVEFFRSGPDNQQDGEGNSGNWLGQDGKAQYVFQGAKAGKAVVTTVGFDNNGDIVDQAGLTDSVQFVNPPKADINLKAGGKDNGPKDDKLKVTANDNASGLVAKVFVNGKKVASHKLNSSGDFTFTIKDKNGGKATKYVVKVAGTSLTAPDKASKKLK